MLDLPPGKLIVLFDGVCNLCNRSVQFIIRHDRKNRFLFASLQSEAGRALLRQLHLPVVTDPESIVLIDGGKAYHRSDAVLRIAPHLGGLWPLVRAATILPRFIRDGLYRLIARNRYRWFGRREECMLPSERLKAKFLV